MEEYWLNRFVTGTAYTPEDLAKAAESVPLQQVVTSAQSIQLDSIYTLRGEED